MESPSKDIEPFRRNDPKISIVSVSYNDGAYISDHVKSVLAQDYPNIQHIIVDIGSSDETLEILSDYPHIDLISEPFHSVAAGFNRGLKEVSGEIVGWALASNRYLPRIFSDVATNLNNSEILLGQCEIIDGNGKSIEKIKNLPRSWFDIWKYWVYNSRPIEPAVFCRTEALKDIEESSGYYFNEDLTEGIHHDLWLRLAEKYPFSKWSEETYGYLRYIDEEEALEKQVATFRESSRLYRRYGHKKIEQERRLSIVIPADRHSQELETTLESCKTQGFADYEVLIWSDLDLSLDSYLTDNRFRTIRSHRDKNSYITELRSLMREIKSPITTILYPGQKLQESGALEISNYFEQDSLAALVLTGGDKELYESLVIEREKNELFNVQSLFSMANLPLSFAFRTLALKELDNEELHGDTAIALRELLLLFQYKAWSVQVVEGSIIEKLPSEAQVKMNREKHPIEYLQAVLIDKVAEIRENDTFAEVRSDNGFIIEFPKETIDAARDFLGK